MFQELKTYKGLKVERKKEKTGKPNVNASYSRISKKITLYDNFFERSLEHQEAILEHEYAHHIWYKMPLGFQNLWKYLHKGTIIKYLKILGWIGKNDRNSFVTSYAQKNHREDFAECVECNFLIEKGVRKHKLNPFLEWKVKTAVNLFNYYK